MIRFIGASVASLFLLAPIQASLLPIKPPVRPVQEAIGLKSDSANAGEFAVNSDTEVMVDGKACKFKDIPAGASITKIEVAADRRTVLRIEFRTKK